MQCVILWFRRDLRLTDNPALSAALRGGARVVPVYVADDSIGGASRWWLHHSLASLDGALRRRGSRLLLRHGPADEALLALAAETRAQAVHWNRRLEPPVAEADRRTATRLRDAGIATQVHGGPALVPPWTVTTGDGGPYRVFTPFWRAIQGRIRPGRIVPPPDALPAPSRWPRSEPLEALALLPRVRWDEGLSRQWTPGEAGAAARLQRFVDSALDGYPRERDRPDVDGTSTLSPSLHFGELSPGRVWTAVAACRDRAPEAVDAFLRQLGWREFAHHVMHHFPHTVQEPLDGRFRGFAWRDGFEPLLAAWQRGLTGFPVVDAGMRQLWRTGWMHNRVRMIAASLLVKNVRAPWQAGAQWFMDTLVDADLANNTLGWQWAGGCGADAAPYFRVFNPVRQGERCDPDGAYVRRWVPELAAVPDKWLHRPWEAPAAVLRDAGVRLGGNYPRPVVDLASSRAEALQAWRQLRAG